MNARILLLVLMVAAFMAIWDADRPAAAGTGMRQAMKRADGVPISSGVTGNAQSVGAQQPRINQPFDDIAVPATSDALILLPKDFPAGTWNAISHDGHTYRITIIREQTKISQQTDFVPR